MIDDFDAWEGHIPPSQRSPDFPWFPMVSRLLIGTLGFVILIGLLLPLISGRPRHNPAAICASNLRQLGLGIAGYTNHYGQFPPGTIPNADLPLEQRLGWGVTLLNWIDEGNYFPDHGISAGEAEKLAVDDPVFNDLMIHPPYIAYCRQSPTQSGYVAMAGLGLDSPSLLKSDPRARIFGDNRSTTPADLKDGASTTMMRAESDSVGSPWFAGDRATVRGLDPTRQPYIGPNRQLGGNHPGGAYLLFADGSAKFVSDTVDPKILEALSTMAGGEAVTPDDL
jgi:prepilin-type processing-associated H-X9-DG protein